MGDVIDFPIKADFPGFTGRDGYIMAEALYLASEWMAYHPQESRSETDRDDMLKILRAAFPGMLEHFSETLPFRASLDRTDM